MKVSNKAHRVMTIVAAILMLLTVLFSVATTVITMITNAANGLNNGAYIATTIFNTAITIVVTVFTVIALFRGKKDIAAAVLFLLTALINAGQSVIARVFTVGSVVSTGAELYGDMYESLLITNIIMLVAGMVAVAVRLLLAGECFKPGMISGNMMKFLLILLPIVYAVLNAVGVMAQQTWVLDQRGLMQYILMAGLPALLTFVGNVPEILLGIAFAIPVYEKQNLA